MKTEPCKLPPLLTGANAEATIRAVLADEGIDHLFRGFEEGPGWVQINLNQDRGMDRGARALAAQARLRSIVCLGVDLRIVLWAPVAAS